MYSMYSMLVTDMRVTDMLVTDMRVTDMLVTRVQDYLDSETRYRYDVITPKT